MTELEKQLLDATVELKALVVKADEQKAAIGAVQVETKAAIDAVMKRMDELDVRLARPRTPSTEPSLIDTLKANPEIEHMMKAKGGRARIELDGKAARQIIEGKTLSTTAVGFSTYGVMPAEREAGVVAMPRPQLRMRDVLPARPTTLADIYWVTETARPTKASPITEYSGLKPTVEPTFSTDHELVQTIAVIAIASRQVLEDWVELDGFLRSELAARVREEEDLQILSGSGSAPNLNGITTQAQSWDLSLLTASDGYEYVDIISGAMQQIAEDNEEMASQFVVLHPGDWWKVRRAKDTTGRYILGDPQTPVAPTLWGAPVVDTTQMSKGYFVVGSGSPRAAEIRDRMGLTIELSTEDSTNFRYNLVTIRAELRLALVIKRPNAFVYGALTQSPA